jgi:hypothetical protein
VFILFSILSLSGFNTGVSGRLSRRRMTILILVLMGIILAINDFDNRSGDFTRINQGSISQVVKDIEMQLAQ